MQFPLVQLPQRALDPQQGSADASSGSNDASLGPSMLGVDLAPNQTVAAPPPSAAPPPVQTDVGASGWTEEIGAHVVWMAHQGISSASLRLQPEHLGPLEVKISLHATTASVCFGASEPETRTALQAALPQLKEMFAAQGMTLTDAGVSREPPREAPSAPASAPSSAAPGNAENAVSTSVPGSRRGLLDTYA